MDLDPKLAQIKPSDVKPTELKPTKVELIEVKPAPLRATELKVPTAGAAGTQPAQGVQMDTVSSEEEEDVSVPCLGTSLEAMF